MSSVQHLIYPAQPSADGWHVIGRQSDLFSDKSCHGTQIDGLKIGLFLVEDRIYALNDICTHGNALLTEGELEGFEIECPLHAGVFDIRDGKALGSPLTRDARWHETRIEDGWVSVRLNDGGAANGR
jgi:nitrite reductase/ring-hydroxylating ferredoxin subunit